MPAAFSFFHKTCCKKVVWHVIHLSCVHGLSVPQSRHGSWEGTDREGTSKVVNLIGGLGALVGRVINLMGIGVGNVMGIGVSDLMEGLAGCGDEHKEPPRIGGVGGKAALRLVLRVANFTSL